MSAVCLCTPTHSQNISASLTARLATKALLPNFHWALPLLLQTQNTGPIEEAGQGKHDWQSLFFRVVTDKALLQFPDVLPPPPEYESCARAAINWFDLV